MVRTAKTNPTVFKRAGKTIVTTEMFGYFPGSHITVDIVFQLKGDRIASLQIAS